MGWFGLRVVSVSGGPPTRSQLTLRWLALVLDGAFFGVVGLVAMLLSPRTQRLGDSLAQTLVVRSTRSTATPKGADSGGGQVAGIDPGIDPQVRVPEKDSRAT